MSFFSRNFFPFFVICILQMNFGFTIDTLTKTFFINDLGLNSVLASKLDDYFDDSISQVYKKYENETNYKKCQPDMNNLRKHFTSALKGIHMSNCKCRRLNIFFIFVDFCFSDVMHFITFHWLIYDYETNLRSCISSGNNKPLIIYRVGNSK